MSVIGHEPAVMRLILIDGQDLVHLFTTSWPLREGTTVECRVTDRDHKTLYGVWPVIHTDDGYLLNIEAADHADIPNGARFRLFTQHASTGRECWIAGPVGRSRR